MNFEKNKCYENNDQKSRNTININWETLYNAIMINNYSLEYAQAVLMKRIIVWMGGWRQTYRKVSRSTIFWLEKEKTIMKTKKSWTTMTLAMIPICIAINFVGSDCQRTQAAYVSGCYWHDYDGRDLRSCSRCGFGCFVLRYQQHRRSLLYCLYSCDCVLRSGCRPHCQESLWKLW